MAHIRVLPLLVLLVAASGALVAAVTPFFGSDESPQAQVLGNDAFSDPTGFEHARQWAQHGGTEIDDADLAEEEEEEEEKKVVASSDG
eukprot:3911074-Rhodomonas_salina.4